MLDNQSPNIKITTIEENCNDWSWDNLCFQQEEQEEQEDFREKIKDKQKDPKNPPLSEDEKKAAENIKGYEEEGFSKKFSYEDYKIDLKERTKEEQDTESRMNLWFSGNPKLDAKYKSANEKPRLSVCKTKDGLVELCMIPARVENKEESAPKQTTKDIWNDGLVELFVKIQKGTSLPDSVTRMIAKSLASSASDILATHDMFSWIMDKEETKEKNTKNTNNTNNTKNTIVVDNPICPSFIPDCNEKSEECLNNIFYQTCVHDFEQKEHDVSDSGDLVSKCTEFKDKMKDIVPEEKKEYSKRMMKKYGFTHYERI